MSVLKRLSNLVRSNVNDALDKAEDPKKILDQTILDMQGEHKKAKKMLLETITLLKQAEKQADVHSKSAADWETKAMAALKAGNEDLARQALAEKTKAEELAAESRAGVESQNTYTTELKSQLKLLEQKIEEAKGKRDELLARLNAAEMKKKQAAIQNGDVPGKDFVNDQSAFDTFDRMAAKIENSEAELEARKELMDISPETQSELAELEKLSKEGAADDALEALKAKMASGGQSSGGAAPAAPAATDDKASAIEDELAKLRAKLDE